MLSCHRRTVAKFLRGLLFFAGKLRKPKNILSMQMGCGRPRLMEDAQNNRDSYDLSAFLIQSSIII
jgi:hypothetical protein